MADSASSTLDDVAAAVIRRANECNLPEHLRLGLTVDAMEEHVASLPADAVERCNAAIPRNEDGMPRFPLNAELNGYVNQYFIKQVEEGRTSVCERLQRAGSLQVGIATVFVSWALVANVRTLIDAIRQHMRQRGLPHDTKFWVCDFVVRQGMGDLAVLTNFANCVSVIGRTVLLLEPWHDPVPLKRTWCVFEVYCTQKQEAPFDVVMSSAQQAAFETALEKDYGSYDKAVSTVDVRTCGCTSATDTAWLLGELERDVGLSACNEQVIGLLREALAAQGKAALARLPAAERGTSALIKQLGRMLQAQGKLYEAEPLLREALEARREMFGRRHPSTLDSLGNLGLLLRDQGKLYEAEPLYREALEAKREMLGPRDQSTLVSLNLGALLKDQGKLHEAEPLLREVLEARREVLGRRHQHTLVSLNSLGALLHHQGKLDEAEPLCREALEARREVLGPRHPGTLISLGNLADVQRERGDLDAASTTLGDAAAMAAEVLGPNHRETLVIEAKIAHLALARDGLVAPLKEVAAHMEAALGAAHPYTRKYAAVVAAASV